MCHCPSHVHPCRAQQDYFLPHSKENMLRNEAEVGLSTSRHTINILTIIKVIVYALYIR